MPHRNPFGAVLRGRPVLLVSSARRVAQPPASKTVSLTAFPDMAGGLFPDLQPRTT